MALENGQLQELLRAWSNRVITPEQEKELAGWLEGEGADALVKEHVRELVENYKPGVLQPAVDWEVLFQAIQARKDQIPIKHVGLLKKWVVAAAAVLIVGFGAAVYLSTGKQAGTASGDQPVATTDVKAPVENKATIQLADGRMVAVDSLQNGLLASQGNVRLVKLADGQIAYQSSGKFNAAGLVYNTLFNPRGSKVIDMALSDGSHVWLNAGSSVTYPVVFAGNERKVTIDGEAYFEVAPDKEKPFFVAKGTVAVKVLGTHFNVSAYADEPEIKITLLEGSVSVQSAKGANITEKIIKPGEQTVAESNGDLAVKKNIDTELVMAWKNGLFRFDRTPMEVVFRQLSRWYDVEVVYENGVPEVKLWGEMKQDLTLQQVIRGFGSIGVEFRVEGKKLIVTKK